MIKCCLVIFLLIVPLLQGANAANNISGSFEITTRTLESTTEGEKDISRILNQAYNLDLRKDLTSKIYFTSYVGINTTDTDDKETTQLFPQFRLNITNDYFNANVGYLLNEKGFDLFGMNPDETRHTTETWTSNFSTKALKYPTIRFRYDEERGYDHLADHKIDSLSKYYELISDYAYKFIRVTLKHTKNEEDDYVNHTDEKTTVNEGRLNFQESFWESRITTSGNYIVTDIEKESISSSGSTSTGKTRKNLIFDAGLRLRPYNWLRISYDYKLDDIDLDGDIEPDIEISTDIDTARNTDKNIAKDGDIETKKETDRTLQTHNIIMRGDARLHKYLNSWVQYQKRLEYHSEDYDTSTDTFTLNFDSTPFETLNTNFIINHLINQADYKTQSKVSSMLLHIIANIWKGVDLSVDGEINYIDDIVGDTDTLTKTINSDLRLQFTKTLTTEMNYITKWTDIENSDGTKTSHFNYTIRTDLYYRPIQTFYFKFAHELQKNENDEDLNYYLTDINWLITEKLRFNLQYKLDQNSNYNTKFSSDLVWDLSKMFVLRFKYDKSREKNDSSNKINVFTTILSAKF